MAWPDGTAPKPGKRGKKGGNRKNRRYLEAMPCEETRDSWSSHQEGKIITSSRGRISKGDIHDRKKGRDSKNAKTH